MTLKRIVVLLPLGFFALVARAQDSTAIKAIDSTLNRLHISASKADAKTYFNLFTSDAIYIGTDAGERWTIAQFRDFAMPYFSKGQGWTYTPRSRHITLANDACRCVAWFDELLDSRSYGTSRGTGVLIKRDGVWKIAQYALTFPIPNDIAKELTTAIKAFESKHKQK